MLSGRRTFLPAKIKKKKIRLVKEVFLLCRNESSVISSWCPFKICRKLSMSKQQQRKEGEQEGLCCFLKRYKWVLLHLSQSKIYGSFEETCDSESCDLIVPSELREWFPRVISSFATSHPYSFYWWAVVGLTSCVRRRKHFRFGKSNPLSLNNFPVCPVN